VVAASAAGPAYSIGVVAIVNAVDSPQSNSQIAEALQMSNCNCNFNLTYSQL